MNNTKHIKVGIDKRGHKYTRQVVDKAKPVKQWYEKFKDLNLTRLPVGIPEKDVTVHVDLNDPVQVNSKCVMSWKDKKSGRTVMIYTKEFLNRNALNKWDKISNMSQQDVDSIFNKGLGEVMNGSNDKFKQAGSIIAMIALTGLRIGQTKGLEATGNKGISTISPEDIEISGDNINVSYIGKSYKQNTASIFGQPELATYLKGLKESKSGKDRLFDIDRNFVDKVLKNKLGYKDLKIKDMRTYVGTSKAKDHLFKDINEVRQQLTGDDKKDTKIINKRLQTTYKYVSEVLNNTPKMAETAYIHPAVRIEYLKQLGKNPDELAKAVVFEDPETISLDTIRLHSIYNELIEFGVPPIDEDDEEDCDQYNLFFFESAQPDILS